MTIVLDMGAWHIEYHRTQFLAVGIGALATIDINLDRPGVFLGGNAHFDNSTVAFDVHPPRLGSTGGTFILTTGNRITQVRIHVLNGGSAQDIGVGVLLFIRDSRNN